MKRPMTFGIAAAVLALVAGACGSDDTDPGGAPEDVATNGQTEAGDTEGDVTGGEGEPTPVRLGASGGSSSTGLLAQVMKDREIDHECGVDFEVSEFSPDQAEQAVMTGQVDAGFFPYLSYATSLDEGRDQIVLLGPVQAHHGALIVREGDPYQSLDDLEGQTIATLNPVSSMYTGMQLLAAQRDIDWPGAFEVISGPPPGLIGFIESGEVEAIIHFDPPVSSLLASGDYREIFALNDEYQEATGDPLHAFGVAVRRELVENDPEAAQGTLCAFQEVLELMSSENEVLTEYQEVLGLSDEAVEIAKERLSEIYITESPEEAEDAVRRQLETAVDLGIVPAVPEGDIFYRFS